MPIAWKSTSDSASMSCTVMAKHSIGGQSGGVDLRGDPRTRNRESIDCGDVWPPPLHAGTSHLAFAGLQAGLTHASVTIWVVPGGGTMDRIGGAVKSIERGQYVGHAAADAGEPGGGG